jgi:hypothetical protein
MSLAFPLDNVCAKLLAEWTIIIIQRDQNCSQTSTYFAADIVVCNGRDGRSRRVQ